MDDVVADDGAALNAECVDRPHVTQHALANVVQMIEFDNVLARLRYVQEFEHDCRLR